MARTELWGDGSRAAQALTDTYVNGTELELEHESFLFCEAVLSGVACTAADLRLQLSFDNGDNWTTWIDKLDRVALRGDVANHQFVIQAPASCQVRLGMKRRAGTADTLALVMCTRRGEAVGDLDETLPLVVNRAEAYSDGAEAPETLTGAFVYGEWFDLGLGDTLELLVEKTTANDPVNVDLNVQTSPDEGTTPYNPTQIDSVAAGFDNRAASIKRITDFTAGTPERRSVVVEGLVPGSWVRVGAMLVGGIAPDLLVYALVIRL